jgi:hypothetical protein
VLLCGDRRSKAAKDNQGDNVTLIEERGNASNYTLARLKRDRPDLAERVIIGEMSANAAAIKAGFTETQKTKRKKPAAEGKNSGGISRIASQKGHLTLPTDG